MLALRFALLLAHALHRRGRVQLAPGTADLVAKFCFDAPCARGAQCNKAPELVVKLSRPAVVRARGLKLVDIPGEPRPRPRKGDGR